MGIQRLRNAAFLAMPRRVAVASGIAGIAVIAFGGVLASLRPAVEREPQPRATLQPVPDAPDDDAERGLTGRVVTHDGEPVQGADVALLPLAHMSKPVEVTTDADGEFRAPDVDVDPGSPYIAEVTYDGERFGSRVLRAPTTELSLVVADVTKGTDDLVVHAESLAVVGDESGLQAVHALNVENDGDRAYAGELVLPLLRGASAIQEGPGLDRRRLELGDGEMTSSAPLLPGRHELSYTYVSQMSKDGIEFTREVTLPTKRYELLVSGDLDLEPSGSLERDTDVRLGPRGEQRTYERFVARDLGPGDRIGGRIVVASGSPGLQIAGVAAAVALALAIIVVGLLRRRRVTITQVPEPVANTT